MKKQVRLFVSLMLTLVMVFTISESALAATYSWTAVKIPGNSAYGKAVVSIPLYKGEMTFKLTKLEGDCSYLLAKVTSSNESLYYVDTTTKSVMLTKVNGEQSFYMGFTTLGNAENVMKLNCYVEHNADIGKLIQAAGIIYY